MQKCLKFLQIRLHNAFADKLILAGRKVPYDMQHIDMEKEKLHEAIEASEDVDIEADDKRANEYLAHVRQKYG